MHGPVLLSWLLTLLTAATGTICLARLRRPDARHPERGSDAAEAAMGLATAVMIASGSRLPAPLWVALFGLLAAVSLTAAAGHRARRERGHRLHHAVGAAAMAYMALARPGHPPHPGMAMPMGWPALTAVLLLYFGSYALWAGSRLLTVDGTRTALPGGPVPQACRLAMGVGMFAMLLAM
ncbi:DUF5134 domain-containing protein [Streptomyces tateyamensis]|uniref:DUF5134 domain-containing protein n=1 Tax=Streptomyces tateyamensis TaxID=565073 RepID=A0A2V4NJV9_9ACTN|nr:DUF5134 domain-containing protein [Streptomyces tateyamensis]PYC85847.1 DUF5134 domain-containing protein [Streptomyces tateyamensis]